MKRHKINTFLILENELKKIKKVIEEVFLVLVFVNLVNVFSQSA